VNILLVNHYAGSPRHGMEYRPYYLAREWVAAGHAVLIVAASRSHVRTRQPDLQGNRALEETIDGVRYRWLKTPAYSGNGIGRVANICAFLSGLWRDAARLVGDFKPDAVIASSTYPMDIWVARRLARMARAKLVYEVHDLWPASPIELGGMPRLHPFILACQKAENDAYRDADAVVSMLPKVDQHMRRHGLDLRKLHIVPNGIAPAEWAGDAAPLDGVLAGHLSDARRAGRTIVGYAGSHGVPNALDVLLDAAVLMKAEDFAFVLVGDGHEKARLAQRVRDEGLERIALFAPIPKAQIPAFLRALDIAYIGWRRLPIYRFGIAPNKLMDYMMAACVVLHSVEAGNDPVADAGCGLTVAPESPDAVAEGLRTLAARTPAERAAMGERGRAFVLAHHSYPVLARRFIDAIAGAAAR
jgi:glycosyltransferase involved in cell wall biosynthesis